MIRKFSGAILSDEAGGEELDPNTDLELTEFFPVPSASNKAISKEPSGEINPVTRNEISEDSDALTPEQEAAAEKAEKERKLDPAGFRKRELEESADRNLFLEKSGKTESELSAEAERSRVLAAHEKSDAEEKDRAKERQARRDQKAKEDAEPDAKPTSETPKQSAEQPSFLDPANAMQSVEDSMQFVCPQCQSNNLDSAGKLCDSCVLANEEEKFMVNQRIDTIFIRRDVASIDTGNLDGDGNPIYADYFVEYSRNDTIDVYNDNSEVTSVTGDEFVSDEGWV